MDPDHLSTLRALVDPTRLRIIARLTTRPADPETLATELRQPLASITRNVEILVSAGLVERRDRRSGAGLAARLDRVGELARTLAALEAEARGRDLDDPAAALRGAWPHEGEPAADTIARLALDADERRTLRAYLVDGQLSTIPAQHGKRDVILRFLLERVFTEDREYPEKEVNQRLALFHPDVASLRRYLVDEGYVQRGAGLYRRRPVLG